MMALICGNEENGQDSGALMNYEPKYLHPQSEAEAAPLLWEIALHLRCRKKTVPVTDE
jgi:hypothetical protein